MVSDTTPESQEAEEESTEEPVGAAEETTETPETEEETPDPVQVLTDRLGAIDTVLEGLSGLDPAKINSALGRVPGLQSAVDEVNSRDPSASFDPRFSANETLLSAVTEALINADSELVSDQSKASLRAAVAQLGDASKERERVTLKREVLAEVQAAATPDTDDATPDVDDLWGQASVDVHAALPEGFDAKTIPVEVWAEGQKTGRPSLAVRHVLNWVDAQTADAIDNLATRKQAAGPGSPSASAGGGDQITAILTKLVDEGVGKLSEDEQALAAEKLGVKLHP